MRVETAQDLREAPELLRWRTEQLTAVGFAPPLARSLAADSRWDLHALIELVERGCPPPLAARILAPLDRDTALDGALLP